MKPITESAAKRRAMALGGKLELPTGKVFNAARTASATAPKPVEKKPAPEPPAKAIKQPEAAISSAAIEKLAAATFTMADSTSALVEGIKRQLSAVPAPLKSVKSWRFTINRDAAGNMTSIDATAKE